MIGSIAISVMQSQGDLLSLPSCQVADILSLIRQAALRFLSIIRGKKKQQLKEMSFQLLFYKSTRSGT